MFLAALGLKMFLISHVYVLKHLYYVALLLTLVCN